MKKLFSLLLTCMMLFLTSCNQTPPNETTSEKTQNQEKPKDSELKDIIIQNGASEFIDIPSRILFEQSGYVFYYSKADGKAYVYCFDPLCDHSGGKCLANPMDTEKIYSFDLKNTFFINNRFYTATKYGQIYSFAFDGSDLKIEYGEESYSLEELNRSIWSPSFTAYDKYIYVPMNADENGNACILRFNVETKEMENLTEKTGNCILPHFFYNDKMYGRVFPVGDYLKANLDLTEVEFTTYPITNYFYGSLFFENEYDDKSNYNNRKVIGLKMYNMKTGETTLLSNEMLGLESNVYNVIAADENYIYFCQAKEILVGTYTNSKGKEIELYKDNDGKLYRVKYDGTECVCIYDNPEFEFISREAIICGNQLIIEGQGIGVRDGIAKSWDKAMKIGTIGSDGKIEKFENIELVY